MPLSTTALGDGDPNQPNTEETLNSSQPLGIPPPLDSNKENQPPSSPTLSDASSSDVVPLPPPPRVAMSAVPVSFTRLETDYLPAREKREKEIREYKRKNKLPGHSGRKIGLDANSAGVESDEDENTTLADSQPLFLKDKGDALFRRGDIYGAITAYTRALQIDPDFLPAAMNRCLSNLEAGRLEECEEEAGEVA